MNAIPYGDLCERSAVPRIGAGVADIESHKVVVLTAADVYECNAGEGRTAHDQGISTVGPSTVAQSAHRIIGASCRCQHVGNTSWPIAREHVSERGDRCLAATITKRMATHPVGHDEERGHGSETVFVHPPHRTTIAVALEANPDGHAGQLDPVHTLDRHSPPPGHSHASRRVPTTVSSHNQNPTMGDTGSTTHGGGYLSTVCSLGRKTFALHRRDSDMTGRSTSR